MLSYVTTMDKEFADGPLPNELDLPRDELLVTAAKGFAQLAYATIANQTSDRDFKLTTWVESADDDRSSALAVDEPIIDWQRDALRLPLMYYTVDREDREIITETKLILDYYKKETDSENTTSVSQLEVFDNDDLKNIVALIGKASLRFAQESELRPQNDGPTLVAIAKPNIDTLAEAERKVAKSNQNILPTQIIDIINETIERFGERTQGASEIFIRNFGNDYTCTSRICHGGVTGIMVDYVILDSKGRLRSGDVYPDNNSDNYKFDSDSHETSFPQEAIDTLLSGTRCKSGFFYNLYKQSHEAWCQDLTEDQDRMFELRAHGFGKNRRADI